MYDSTDEPQIDRDILYKHHVLDATGRKLKFGHVLDHDEANRSRYPSVTNSSISYNEKDLIEGQPLTPCRTLVIFIRHFFCGYCQEYLRRLSISSALSTSRLEENKLKVVIIGCGAPSLIDSYRAVTSIPDTWQVYSEPTTKLYKVLGMHRSLSIGHHNPDYVQRSFSSNMLRSMIQGLRRIPQGDVGSAGAFDVQGGEFLFETTSNNEMQLKWCHRMQHSRDHTEVEDLLCAIGLQKEPTMEIVMKKSHHQRTQTMPVVLDQATVLNEKLEHSSVSRKNSLQRSMSLRRQGWRIKSAGLGRSISIRGTMPLKAAG